MRILVTGGSGVLGRSSIPLLQAAGYDVHAPRRDELDLFDRKAVVEVARGVDAIIHLATSIPPLHERANPQSWEMNDRLRVDASRNLVSAGLQGAVQVFVQSTVTFVYPPGRVDEDTPLGHVPRILHSALTAEEQARRFSIDGRRGVVLRLGLLYGPGSDSIEPFPELFGAVLHVDDAGAAVVAALGAPAGIYNVVEDGGRVSNERFKKLTGWRARHTSSKA